jgi:hypothetical protein
MSTLWPKIKIPPAKAGEAYPNPHNMVKVNDLKALF